MGGLDLVVVHLRDEIHFVLEAEAVERVLTEHFCSFHQVFVVGSFGVSLRGNSLSNKT